MNKTNFWAAIDRSRREAEGDPEMQVESLHELLLSWPVDEILAFDRLYGEYFDQANRWSLHSAADLIRGVNSDEGFVHFRDWLISRGERNYEAVLLDPDTLVNMVQKNADCELAGWRSAIVEAWSEKSGGSPQDYPQPATAMVPPQGERWSAQETTERLPRLAKKFA